MGQLIREMEPINVAELKRALADLPDDMPVTDAIGECLLLRIYDIEGITTLEVG